MAPAFDREPGPDVMTRPSREGGRVALVVLFAVYLILLVWVVLWKLELPHVDWHARGRFIKLVPFVAGAGSDASGPVEVFANIVLFVPFGIYLGLLAPSWQWWRAAGAVAVASLLLEIAQYVLALGISDVTDIVANTAGGLAGIGLLALARRKREARGADVMRRVCSIGTVIALLACGILAESPLRFAPLDVPLHPSTALGGIRGHWQG